MKKAFKKVLEFFLNPHLWLCLLVAWLVTNGWSYILFFCGNRFGIAWMAAISGAYITFLWLPFTPEKVVTVAIAIALLRWWFPNDQHTLAVLKELHTKAKDALKAKKPKKKRENSPPEKNAEKNQET